MNTYRSLLCMLAILIPLGLLDASCSSSDEIVSPTPEWELTVSDEFDSDALSRELWVIETGYGPNNDGWGNDEWQLYTDSSDNVRVEGGNLVISAQCPEAPCSKRDDSITSARIKTQGLFEQEHGRFEARIKLPAGTGFWPAFWMLGANIEEVPWPGCGEIDIMESYGRNPGQVAASLHGPGYFGAEPISNEFDLPDGETFADDFHVFAVEWDPARMTFWVDSQVQDGVVVGGEVYHTVSSAQVASRGEWVFNNEFFMLLNLAVEPTRAGAVDAAAFPADMLVDYVRVYERAR